MDYNPQNPQYPGAPMAPQGYPQAQPVQDAYGNPVTPNYGMPAGMPDQNMGAYAQPAPMAAPATSTPPAMSPEAMAFLSGQDMNVSKKSGKKGGFFPGFVGGLLAVIIVGGLLFINGSITVDDLVGGGSGNVASQVSDLSEAMTKVQADATTMGATLQETGKTLEEISKHMEEQDEAMTKMADALEELSDDVNSNQGNNSPSSNNGTNANANTSGGLSADDIRALLNQPSNP